MVALVALSARSERSHENRPFKKTRLSEPLNAPAVYSHRTIEPSGEYHTTIPASNLKFNMDPYTNIIANDRGDEVKKRIIERDGEENEEPPTKRARANTTTLIPSEVTNDERPPQPEAILNKYDHARLQRGLRYVVTAAKRKVTPRTASFLQLHKDAYKVALERNASDEKSVAVVQILDEVYSLGSFHYKPDLPDEHNRLMVYVNLRKLELLTNYGDYLGHGLQDVKADLKEKPPSSGDDDLEKAASASTGLKRQIWIIIAESLEGDKVSELRNHVYAACHKLGLETEHMLWLIEQYAARKHVFQNQALVHIDACHWNSLAQQIFRDLTELLSIVPDDLQHYEKAIVDLRDKYLVVIDPKDPQTWLPSSKATELSKLKAANSGEQGVKKS